MDLLDGWKLKFTAGRVRYDPGISMLHRGEGWGTVYYSDARERYKVEVSERPRTSFDPVLMSELHISEHDVLNIAANPNSLFEGHLVIYPKNKAETLSCEDIHAIANLAIGNPHFTFIHNAENSAASVLDWVHFQAYHLRFPIEEERHESIFETEWLSVGRVNDDFPAYAIRFESDDPATLARIVTVIEAMLRSGKCPGGRRVPLNLVWRGNRVWVVPRAKGQSQIAASYFGGLEIGGIFCVPRADLTELYSPDSLRREMINSTLWAEEDTREWFERAVLGIGGEGR